MKKDTSDDDAFVTYASPEGQRHMDWLDEYTDKSHLKKGKVEGMIDPIAMAVRRGMRELYLEIKRKRENGERRRKA